MTRHDQGTEASHDLHKQIINLRRMDVDDDWTPGEKGAYRLGHRDARHAAAELGAAVEAAHQQEIARLTQERDALAAQIAGLREALTKAMAIYDNAGEGDSAEHLAYEMYTALTEQGGTDGD